MLNFRKYNFQISLKPNKYIYPNKHIKIVKGGVSKLKK